MDTFLKVVGATRDNTEIEGITVDEFNNKIYRLELFLFLQVALKYPKAIETVYNAVWILV